MVSEELGAADPLRDVCGNETTQYITGLGVAEFDDVFGNTMGGWIGVLVSWTWLSRKMSVKNRA